eukprot:Gregarina_sp_Pseudo_9__4060@NODE_41_length_5268_cov_56_056607_g38_i0_p3_GENE_NODE_41_length_5268_cov_56_056607_g38_i0NODE_41_length_5268_cov_56_056607_g38_i0_p3_ORF_typecomplete_len336_score52_77Arf/PF00025_21/8e06Arf/PF00025_21/3_6e21SRPRB/PF09439_10/1_8SRPRB/PF09439_10/5_5e08Ras/PF00071_22/0_63Ras/PF00071_22/1_5e05Gtr1_RagA/PF04670_12/7_9Gtr1_RagA/PF04670_12/0_11Roc/PF08477_13/0_44Roc/PF08477_13/59GTP_EFTU/PF00009_27/2_2e03GTP_EFTU/PF00009_27/0_038FeoB_N/PF02421_18/1_2e02FeoB_N/PF02421_18/1_9_
MLPVSNVTQRFGRSRTSASTRELFDEVDTTSDIIAKPSLRSDDTDSTAVEGELSRAYLSSLTSFWRWLQPPPLSSQVESPSMKIVVWGAKRSGKTSIIYRWKLDTFIPTVPTIGLLEESHDHFNGSLRCHVCLSLYEIGRDPISVEMKAVPIQKNYSDSEADSEEDSGVDQSLDTEGFRQRRRRRRRYGCCSTVSRCCKCFFCCDRRKQRSQAIDFAVEIWTKVVKKANAVVYVVDSSCKVSLLEMFDDLNLILHNDHLKSQNARFLILANKQDVWGAVSAFEIEKMLRIPRQMEKRCKVMPCSALTGENLELALAWLEDWMTLKVTSLQLATSH